MAAYGALITLTNLMKPIRHYQAARYPVFANHQLIQLESLEQKALLLQKFLETYSTGRRSHDFEALEDQIEDVVYYAQDFIESRIADVIRAHFRGLVDAESDADTESDEDAESITDDPLIESHIADHILALCKTTWKTESDDLFSQVLQKVIQVLDLIQDDASKIAENVDILQKDKQPRDSTTSIGLNMEPTADQFKDPSTTFGDALAQMMDKLLNIHQKELDAADITSITDAFGLLRVYDAMDIKFPKISTKLLQQLIHLRILLWQ